MLLVFTCRWDLLLCRVGLMDLVCFLILKKDMEVRGVLVESISGEGNDERG